MSGCFCFSLLSLGLCWFDASVTVAFSPARHLHRTFPPRCYSISNVEGLALGRRRHASRRVRSGGTIALNSISETNEVVLDIGDADTTEDEIDGDNGQSSSRKRGLSFAALLKAIDKSHSDEATQSYSYLSTEAEAGLRPQPVQRDGDGPNSSYHLSEASVLSDESVKALRRAARAYFEERRSNDGGAWGVERVELSELLSTNERGDIGWTQDLDSILTQHVYPSVRSNWLRPESTPIGKKDSPVLTVTSASVFAGGGYPGTQVAMTTLERDAGLFVVHVDLGNDGVPSVNMNGISTMGAIYLESLVSSNTRGRTQKPKHNLTDAKDVARDKSKRHSNDSIIGPLSPGQLVIHRSMERSAAVVVPSNIHESEVECNGVFPLDTLQRRSILRAAESTRHFALRLVLTTKSDDDSGIREAPPEERSYRLRSYAKFTDDRVHYLTLAGLQAFNDYENHLWLGFEYLSQGNNPDNQLDLRQRLSNINRAIFHLEKAEDLCPSDARIPYQLASAIKAKMDCERELCTEADILNEATGTDLIADTADFAKMAAALERSAQVESASVKWGVNGIHDLSICLSALAETRCKMGEFDKALDAIDKWAECGSIRSKLAFEDTDIHSSEIPNHEWIQVPEGDGDTNTKMRKVAVRTIGDVPVFEQEDIALLRHAADKHFHLASGIQTSRYTMQYEGNSEVHLDDLCSANPELFTRMSNILQEKVYPLVRAAFSDNEDLDEDEPPLGPLCVYDSIFVRYNGDEAKAAGRKGASQPLHQDGGIYSVNIALNAHRDDTESGFTGGGTFLEALTLNSSATGSNHIQRPIAPGHAIIHKTTQRHAGAPTTSGIRDILVIFLTARRPPVDIAENTWKIERAMRLQSLAKELPRDKLISSLELARNNDPSNSEVPYLLGVHLIQGDMDDPSDQRWREICQGVESLKLSTMLNQADARAHYSLGMAISTRHKYAMRTKRAHLLPPADEAAESLIKSLEMAIYLERNCERAGCKNGINLAAAFLAMGDFMARLKSFHKAKRYLNEAEECINLSGDQSWAQSMLHEVLTISDFCARELAKKDKATVS